MKQLSKIFLCLLVIIVNTTTLASWSSEPKTVVNSSNQQVDVFDATANYNTACTNSMCIWSTSRTSQTGSSLYSQFLLDKDYLHTGTCPTTNTNCHRYTFKNNSGLVITPIALGRFGANTLISTDSLYSNKGQKIFLLHDNLNSDTSIGHSIGLFNTKDATGTDDDVSGFDLPYYYHYHNFVASVAMRSYNNKDPKSDMDIFAVMRVGGVDSILSRLIGAGGGVSINQIQSPTTDKINDMHGYSKPTYDSGDGSGAAYLATDHGIFVCLTLGGPNDFPDCNATAAWHQITSDTPFTRIFVPKSLNSSTNKVVVAGGTNGLKVGYCIAGGSVDCTLPTNWTWTSYKYSTVPSLATGNKVTGIAGMDIGTDYYLFISSYGTNSGNGNVAEPDKILNDLCTNKNSKAINAVLIGGISVARINPSSTPTPYQLDTWEYITSGFYSPVVTGVHAYRYSSSAVPPATFPQLISASIGLSCNGGGYTVFTHS